MYRNLARRRDSGHARPSVLRARVFRLAPSRRRATLRCGHSVGDGRTARVGRSGASRRCRPSRRWEPACPVQVFAGFGFTYLMYPTFEDAPRPIACILGTWCATSAPRLSGVVVRDYAGTVHGPPG